MNLVVAGVQIEGSKSGDHLRHHYYALVFLVHVHMKFDQREYCGFISLITGNYCIFIHRAHN